MNNKAQNISFEAEHALAWSEQYTLDGTDKIVFYFWTPKSTCAVLGLSQDAERELEMPNLAQDKVRVVRRASGGGAVILCEGVLCFGAIAPQEYLKQSGQDGIRASFRYLTSHVTETCQELGMPAVTAGISDISAASASESAQQDDVCLYKIAGCAQLRKRGSILVHGSLLVQTDISIFERYLAFPSQIPDYRSTRSHTDFCRNLNSLLKKPIDMQSLEEKVCRKAEEKGWQKTFVSQELCEEALWQYEKKYMRREWNINRKRPPAK